MPELLGVTSTMGHEPERYHLLQLSRVRMRVDTNMQITLERRLWELASCDNIRAHGRVH